MWGGMEMGKIGRLCVCVCRGGGQLEGFRSRVMVEGSKKCAPS